MVVAPWPGFEPGIVRVTAGHTGPDYTTRESVESRIRRSIIKFAPNGYLSCFAVNMVAVRKIFGIDLSFSIMNVSRVFMSDVFTLMMASYSP